MIKKCFKCGYEWEGRIVKPKSCPECKSRKWEGEKMNKKISTNHQTYINKYSGAKECLKYPADWIIRFHNMYLKKVLPKGKVLDFGCGSGNNSLFFIEKNYNVYGVDITNNFEQLVKSNLKRNNLSLKALNNFSIISTDCTSLPFKDEFFDFILSNQVLYYLPSKEHIQKVCRDMARCLKPNGLVFFTMMGTKNDYISKYSKSIKGNIHKVLVDTIGHRLEGTEEEIYNINNEDELKDLFSEFECISTGYFNQSMLEMSSNFHWIFIGKKRK